MEDRYLFKGKRIDNGEWVQGALFNGESHCIIGQEIKFSPYTEHECKIVGYEVDIDTICQCTGLKDTDGKLIWENDIVKGKYYDIGKSHRHIGKVKYVCEAYKVVGVKQYTGYHDHLDGSYEVIGNKFDNPELLEV